MKIEKLEKFLAILHDKTDCVIHIRNLKQALNHGLLRKEKNKKVIGLMKEELGGKIMIKFVQLSATTYSYLIDDGVKKAKCTKKCVIKRTQKFENYKNCLEATQLGNKINYLEIGKLK